jgi:hypothetical protein
MRIWMVITLSLCACAKKAPPVEDRANAALPPVAAHEAAPPGPSAPSEWKPFTSPAGRFSVLMLGAPHEQEKPLGGQSGALVAYIFSTTSPAGKAYMAMYADYPPSVMKGDRGEIERMIDGARDGALHSAGARLVEEKPIKLDGNFGRELVLEKQDRSMVSRMRVYVVGARLYTVQALSASGLAMPDPDAERFLDSFKLLSSKKQPPK